VRSPRSSILSTFPSTRDLEVLSGAMLLGSADFCDEARTWLRRFGGNLYTVLPYAVSGWAGYRRHWVNLEETMSFDEKYHKLLRLVMQISKEGFVSFDPEIPEVNMVHGYFRHHVDDVNSALDLVELETGLRVLKRVGTVAKGDHAYRCGYRSRFEWTMGASNAAVPDCDFVRSWKALGSALANC
jgi:threonine aldolase